VRRLVDELGLRTVVDLRTGAELELEGPGPLTRVDRVAIEHHSLYPETGGQTDIDAEIVVPWGAEEVHPDDAGETPTVQVYLAYLRHRPDSVVGAVRAIATPPDDGAVLVHCAAGKDRTGVVVALALDAAGVAREEVVADYLVTRERIEAIVARLAASPTYADEVRPHDTQSHAPRPGTMERVLELVDERHGGAAGWLREHGLTEDELASLRARLRR
jgi:protein-tyrosine phosphatase